MNRLTGALLILMAVLAGYAFGYAYPLFDFELGRLSLHEAFVANRDTYKYMLIAIGAILLLDLFVSYTLYRNFEDVDESLSKSMALLRIAYTFIFAWAGYYLFLNHWQTDLNNDVLAYHYHGFTCVWDVALTLFGVHLFLLGRLMKQSIGVPKFLSILMLIAGVCYIVYHPIDLVWPDADITQKLEMILGIPMALGELLFAFWLLFKGGGGFQKTYDTASE